MATKKTVFIQLSTLDLTASTKAIQGNRYLPWNIAWGELCKLYPTATYTFHEDEKGLPFLKVVLEFL